jgi:hypothetical protein
MSEDDLALRNLTYARFVDLGRVSGRGGHPAWAEQMFWLKRNRLRGS